MPSPRVFAHFVVFLVVQCHGGDGGSGEVEEMFKEFVDVVGGDGEPCALQDRAVSSVRRARLVPLRRQVSVRSRTGRPADARPTSQVSDSCSPPVKSGVSNIQRNARNDRLRFGRCVSCVCCIYGVLSCVAGRKTTLKAHQAQKSLFHEVI